MDNGIIETVKGLNDTLGEIWMFCKSVWNFICNPTEVIGGVAKATFVNVIGLSYWVLLLSAMICLILSMAGCKKTKNGATISLILYIILQCFAKVLI